MLHVINAYSDFDRFIPCKNNDGSYIFYGELPLLYDPQKAMEANTYSTDAYDLPLLLLGIYHIIEWSRMTLFLTSVLLGSNFLRIWYATSLNTLFGIAAYITCHIARYSGNSTLCAEKQ